MDDELCEPRIYWRTALWCTAGVGLLTLTTLVSEPPDGRTALDITVAVVAVGLVPFLLRRPVTAALIFSAMAAFSPAAIPAATAFALTVALRRPFKVALAVAATGAAALAIEGAWRPHDGLTYGWWLVLVMATYAAILGWGAMVQARRQLVESLEARARRAEEEQGRRVAEARVAERTRIAREMHDVLAHRLSLVATYAGALEYRPDASPEQITEAAGIVRAGVREALVELREIVTVLRDDDRDDQRPQPVVTDIPRLVDESRLAGQRISLVERLPEPISTVTGRTAYRVVQEGLTNARKHAAGQPVRVLVDGSKDHQLIVELRNPLAAQGLPGLPGSGAGLVGLTERVRLAGGTLDHQLTGDEFLLSAKLPT